jgi:hypothetical protein
MNDERVGKWYIHNKARNISVVWPAKLHQPSHNGSRAAMTEDHGLLSEATERAGLQFEPIMSLKISHLKLERSGSHYIAENK